MSRAEAVRLVAARELGVRLRSRAFLVATAITAALLVALAVLSGGGSGTKTWEVAGSASALGLVLVEFLLGYALYSALFAACHRAVDPAAKRRRSSCPGGSPSTSPPRARSSSPSRAP